MAIGDPFAPFESTPATAVELSKIDFQGTIREDVMSQIFDVSPIETPTLDLMSVAPRSRNFYRSWTQRDRAAVDITNARAQGSDPTADHGRKGKRVGNHHQILYKALDISKTAEEVDNIGYASEMAIQIMDRQDEIKKDQDGIFLTHQASVEDTGDKTTPGLTAGIGAWIETNVQNGTAGGFANGIVAAPTPGTSAGFTEVMLKKAQRDAWMGGGRPNILVSTPDMIENISSYMFTANAQIATLTASNADKVRLNQVNVGGRGQRYTQGLIAIASVNVYTGMYGTLTLMPDINMQTYTNVSENVNVYFLDMDRWQVGYLWDTQVEPLAKTTALAEKREMTLQTCTICESEVANASVLGINPATAMAAS